MATEIDVSQDNNRSSIIRPALGKRINDILDSAASDPAKGLEEARRMRAWLRRQVASGRAHPDVQHVLGELDILIELLRKG